MLPARDLPSCSYMYMYESIHIYQPENDFFFLGGGVCGRVMVNARTGLLHTFPTVRDMLQSIRKCLTGMRHRMSRAVAISRRLHIENDLDSSWSGYLAGTRD